MVDVKDTLKNLVKGFKKVNQIDDATVKRQMVIIEAAKLEAKRLQAEKE